MRIMSYNIHHGTDLGGENTLTQIGDLIYDLDIEICFLQELDFSNDRSLGIDQLAFLSKRTKLPFTAYGKNLEYRNGFYGNGILSSTPLSNIKNVVFPALGRDTKPDVGGKEHKPEPRGVLTAETKYDDKMLSLVVTHSSMWEPERLQSNAYILEHLKHQTCIAGGDFNTDSEAELHFLNKYNLSSDKIATYPVPDPKFFIDKFYVSELEVFEIFRVDAEYSDHYPVIIEIKGR